MFKKEQILQISPENELRFRGPFTVLKTSYITITNPTEHVIVFKIKTTAPKKYCVRPNCGFIKPEEKVEVAVCLQPFEYDPNEKHRHKFMVQSMIAPEENFEPVFEKMWKRGNPEDLMDTKLKCVFEFPVSGSNIKKPTGTSESSYKEDTQMSEPETELCDAEKASTTTKSPKEDEGALRKKYSALQAELSALAKENEYLRANQRVIKPPSPMLQTSQMPLLVIAIITGLIGVILGKFLL